MMSSGPELPWPLRRSGEAAAAGARSIPAVAPVPAASITLTTRTAAGAPGWVALLLAEVGWTQRAWLFSRLVLGPRALAGEPGLRFARVLGSGRGGGFGLRPSFAHGGVIAFFDDEGSATRFVHDSATAALYRGHSESMLVAVLATLSARGSWAGQRLAPATQAAHGTGTGRIAALTRAAIRPQRAWPFWRHAPAAERALADAAGCELVAGLGEAPLLRQATISVWSGVRAMEAYARSGAHLEASRAAWQGQHFSESMFARFQVRLLSGRWQGREHG